MENPNGSAIGATILVAEGHPTMRETITRILKRDFDVVGTAENGPEALERTIRLIPDVLVLNVLMPHLDGRDVVRQLKEQGVSTKTVFVSVALSAEHITSCFDAGGDAYVVKAKLATDLIPAVRGVLAGHRFTSSF